MPGEELRYADAQRLTEFVGDTRFDLIIAGDVIEHLANQGSFLAGCREALTADGTLLVTTVNAYGITRFAKALLNHEAVHPEHTAYSSHQTLKRLLSMSVFRAVSVGYYRCEPVPDRSVVRLVGNALENFMTPFWPQFSEGLIVEATADAGIGHQ
jgi:predicted TPR repeat methyltransferase